MVARLLPIALVLLAPSLARGQHRAVPDAGLQLVLDSVVAGFGGEVGYYVRHLPSGREASRLADQRFPTASLIKLPILVALFDAVERGDLAWGDRPRFSAGLRYGDGGLVDGLRDSVAVPLAELAHLMMSTSDNTAALWLQGLIGGAAVNRWLADHGFPDTRVNSRTPGREADRSVFGWGQTTPREMAELLIRIREGHAVSPAADQELYRLLTRSYWTGEALSALPPWVQAASKQGAVDRSRSEVVLVNAPSGDYVFSVITRLQRDTSWVSENEGYRLLRAVSASLWRVFEPDYPWQPASGADRWKP